MILLKKMKLRYFILSAMALAGCAKQDKTDSPDIRMKEISTQYVKLGLHIGQYDRDFVDAYYGPDSLKPTTAVLPNFPKDSIIKEISALQIELEAIEKGSSDERVKRRALWIKSQLIAFEERVRIFSGETRSFDEESKRLFDAVAPTYEQPYFENIIQSLDKVLPGSGPIETRFELLSRRFVIPGDKIDTVFQTAIAEARKRTLAHYTLPESESFELEYVKDKPWSGYNWYQGKYKSKIQINISQPIFIERALDLACHEGYPGHHVYNTLLEKNLYNDKGYTEIALYPLFSPQSLIAEGSANYGISMAFPESQQKLYCKEVLMPLAGMDTTGADQYFKALELKSRLNYARNEVARGVLNGKMNDEEAMKWLIKYTMLTETAAVNSLNFIKKYRSYVINYNFGQDLIKHHIESKLTDSSTEADRWKAFEELLSNEYKASDFKK